MGLAGVSGPFRGAYNTFSFGTNSVGANTGNLGTIGSAIWGYTVPAGMDIVIVDAQIFCGAIGTNTRLNLLAGGASILKNDANANPSTAQGVGLTSAGTLGVGNATVNATLSNAVFANAATSIIAPTTPSLNIQAPRFAGAYIRGGATLSATVSNGSTATGMVTCTLLWYPVSHPDVVRSPFE